MDVKLFYREKGEGPPLVLLHGNGESGEYFSAQMDFFSQDYRVIAVDTRGHGRSPRGEAPFTLEQFAEDLQGFLDSLQLDRVNLLGFSDGANIALLFALRWPERVEKLVLNGGNLFPDGVKAAVQLPICLGYGITCLFGRKARANREMLGLMVKGPHISPEALAALDIPALVIVGEKDMIKERHSRLIAASLPKGELAVIPGDHFIAAKNSKEFNQVVAAFLPRKSH